MTGASVPATEDAAARRRGAAAGSARPTHSARWFPTARLLGTDRSSRANRPSRTRPSPLVRLDGRRGRALGFAAIGLSGFAPNLGVLWLLTAQTAVPLTLAVVTANQAAILWNFLLTDRLLYRRARHGAPVEAYGHRSGAARLARGFGVRLAAYAGLSNTDLLVRVPLTHWLVTGLGGEPVAVTAALLVALAAVRFLAIDRLLYRAKKRSDHHVPR